MKIVMLTTRAGPNGVVHPGTVLEVSEQEGSELIAARYAAPYVAARSLKRRIETASIEPDETAAVITGRSSARRG